jgi:metal-responsive CopG/Arc/MetJ family transcriptional regulator
MSNKSDRVHLVMPKYLKADLDKFSQVRGVSMASVVNDAVKEYLKHYQNQRPPMENPHVPESRL